MLSVLPPRILQVQLVVGDEGSSTPAVPHFLDEVAINEYVRSAGDSINP